MTRETLRALTLVLGILELTSATWTQSTFVYRNKDDSKQNHRADLTTESIWLQGDIPPIICAYSDRKAYMCTAIGTPLIFLRKVEGNAISVIWIVGGYTHTMTQWY